MTADVVGYAYCSRVWDVTLMDGSVTGNATEISGEGMYGGIVAAGMGSRIEGCRASAAVGIPEEYSETMIKSCIRLFVDENVGEAEAETEQEEAEAA